MLTSGGYKEKMFLRSTVSPRNAFKRFSVIINCAQKRKSEKSWQQRRQILNASEMVKI